MGSPSAITSSESGLSAALAELRARGRPGLIPYFTAGYPDPAASLEMLRAADGLSDVIEVGVPFSDPLADGPTIQRSTFEALRKGMTLPRTLELVARAGLRRPVVIFGYLNPILSYGVDRFLKDAAAAGVAGLLLTDLPAGADPEVEAAVQASPLDLIRLVAPTTSPRRLAEVVAGAEGFVYLIARLGVTGASAALDQALEASVARVRSVTTLPVAVGFGISTPQQAAAVARSADGVVVGSALADALAHSGIAGAAALLAALREAIDSAREAVA